MSLYKNRDCFFIYSSFLAGKEAKEAGGTYDGSPLTPFQRSTGTLSPSIAPAQWGGGERFSSNRSRNGTARATFHRRAAEDAGWRGLRFSSGFWFGRGCRRCGAKVELFNTARAESERVLKPKNLPGAESWPNTEILAGKGSGYQPPTAALG